MDFKEEVMLIGAADQDKCLGTCGCSIILRVTVTVTVPWRFGDPGRC